MGRVSQTDQAMLVMKQLLTVEARLEYQRRLPKGIAARVLNKILDNARIVRAEERYYRRIIEQFNRMAKIEKRGLILGTATFVQQYIPTSFSSARQAGF